MAAPFDWRGALCTLSAKVNNCVFTSRPPALQIRPLPECPRAVPVKTGSPEMLYLFVFTQFRTQNRFPLLLELL
jgi:hypothetical protein